MIGRILPLVIAPDPRLKQITQDIDDIDNDILQLIEDLFTTLKAHKAIGLTAAHLGISKSIIIIDINQPLIFINPKLIYSSQDCHLSNEASLSFPGINVKIMRHYRVIVEYLDQKSQLQQLELAELPSYCLQHELDQLQGITILDRVSKLQRDFLLKKLIKYKHMLK